VKNMAILIEEKVKKYKIELRNLEQEVKKWEKEFKIKEIGKIAKKCYEDFIELNMSIINNTKNDSQKRKKYELECYKIAYEFLSEITNDFDSIDVYILLLNKVSEFKNLIEYYNKYCSKIEKKYNFDPDLNPSHQLF
jgi:phage-related tail protein